MSQTSIVDFGQPDSLSGDATQDLVTMRLADQLFGIPILSVQDVLAEQRITRVPLAPPGIAGSLNLRGRIVTAIDMRCRMGLEPRPTGESGMSVVAEHEGELYSLLFDAVGDVLRLEDSTFEHNPVTLDPLWRSISGGLYRLEDRLLVVLDVARVLHGEGLDAA